MLGLLSDQKPYENEIEVFVIKEMGWLAPIQVIKRRRQPLDEPFAWAAHFRAQMQLTTLNLINQALQFELCAVVLNGWKHFSSPINLVRKDYGREMTERLPRHIDGQFREELHALCQVL